MKTDLPSNNQKGDKMRIREQLRGNKNICGARIEALRKEKGLKQIDIIESLALQGVDLNNSGLSKSRGSTEA